MALMHSPYDEYSRYMAEMQQRLMRQSSGQLMGALGQYQKATKARSYDEGLDRNSQLLLLEDVK